MALNKIKNNITYYNLKTMEPECSYNECYKKFTPEVTVEAGHSHFITEKYGPNAHFMREHYHHVCNTCGRRESNKKDKNKTYKAWFSGELDAVQGIGLKL